MKNEVAFGYEARLRHIKNEKCASLHASECECFILAKPMLHFSLKWTDTFQNTNMKEIIRILEAYKEKVVFIKRKPKQIEY